MPERQYLTQVGRATIERPFHDLRKITRIFTVNGGGLPIDQVNTEVLLPYGTADGEFTTALLIDRQMQQTNAQQNSFVTGLTEIYQEFTAGQKVSIGEDQIIRLEDGREALVRRYVALATEAEGLAAQVGDIYSGKACQEAKIIKHGVGAEIIETYISAGILAQSTNFENNGALELRSITYYNGTPETPAGFTLIGTLEQNPEGLPGRTYKFAKGNGQISYDPTSEHNGALLKVTIRHLTTPAGSNPIGTPSGFTLVSGPTLVEADGHRIYTAGFAKGNGEISRKTSYRSSADAGTNGITIIAITHLTSPAVTSNPIDDPAGTVLIDLEKNEQDGYRLWRAVYAKGIGRSRIREQSRADGSIVYTVTELATSEGMPDYPGTGTGVPVEYDRDQGEGFFINSATWIKLPATNTISERVNFPMPGYVFFSGTQLIMRPPTIRGVWVEREITYGTDQLTPTVFSVERYGSFAATWTPTDAGIAQATTRALGSYICDGNTVFGTDDEYNGVQCDTFSATTFASTPSELPTGETIIDAQNDEYVTALDGTIYYRRSVLTANF